MDERTRGTCTPPRSADRTLIGRQIGGAVSLLLLLAALLFVAWLAFPEQVAGRFGW